MNAPFGKLTDYKHLGVQIASDVYLPKDCVNINICAEPNGKDIIASVNLPTLSNVFYPTTSGSNININKIFKKFNPEEKEIKSISISLTPYFFDNVDKVVKASKPAINLFIGKIVLYRARTIPIYHDSMRFKFYHVENGKIKHYGEEEISEGVFRGEQGPELSADHRHVRALRSAVAGGAEGSAGGAHGARGGAEAAGKGPL